MPLVCRDESVAGEFDGLSLQARGVSSEEKYRTSSLDAVVEIGELRLGLHLL